MQFSIRHETLSEHRMKENYSYTSPDSKTSLSPTKLLMPKFQSEKMKIFKASEACAIFLCSFINLEQSIQMKIVICSDDNDNAYIGCFPFAFSAWSNSSAGKSWKQTICKKCHTSQ